MQRIQKADIRSCPLLTFIYPGFERVAHLTVKPSADLPLYSDLSWPGGTAFDMKDGSKTTEPGQASKPASVRSDFADICPYSSHPFSSC